MSKTKSKLNGKPNKRPGAVPPATNPTRPGRGGGVSESVAKSAAAEKVLQEATPPPRPASDYPAPPVLKKPTIFKWNEDAPAYENYLALGALLAAVDDIYRSPSYGGGLFLASPNPVVPPMAITGGEDLAPVLADRVAIQVIKGGKIRGNRIPPAHLKTMLRSETFLQQFRVVDQIVKVPCYLPNFSLVSPGYNDGGKGNRILYAGEPARVATTYDAINRFLDVMDFSCNADRTNALAGALTVLLRNFWLGAKPLIVATSTKSHGGKETVIEFCCGSTPHVSLSYETADWALQKNFSDAVENNPEVGLLNIENVRRGNSQPSIRSAFLERILTDPSPILRSTGTGNSRPRRNDLVLAMTTNFGNLSEDLLNRALPIHLEPKGDVANRKSPIGNPRLEYLPNNREQIDAELRGMIEAWKSAGMPLDEDVKHPSTAWAKTIGGILRVAGYDDFLANYGERKTVNDPIRHALGLLGAEKPNEWLRSSDWELFVADLGLMKVLIPAADQESPKSRRRGLGTVLSAHQDETFNVQTDDAIFTMQLKKHRARFKQPQPSWRYMFHVLKKVLVPVDVDPPEVMPPKTG